MQNDTEQKYNEVLSSLGLSQEKIDYIRHANHDTNKFSKLDGSTLYLILTLIPTIIYIIAYILIINVIGDYLIKGRTQGIDYIFYDSPWTARVIPMMMIGIVLPAWLLYKLLDYFPKASVLLAVKSFDEIACRSVREHDSGKWKFIRWCMRRLMDNKFHSMPIEQGFDYLNRKTRKYAGICTIVFMVIGTPLMVLNGLNYKLLTKEGVIKRDYASFQTIQKTWNDVTKVETGCYFNENDKNLTLKYIVYFNDDSKVDLFESKPKEDTVTGIKRVDTILQELGKPFSINTFWDARVALPFVNDACFPKLREEYKNQYIEIVKLLHLEKYSVNP